MADDRVEVHPAAERHRTSSSDGAVSERRGWRRLLLGVLAVMLAVLAVRALLVQSFVVPTASMAPTIQAGDRVIVSRLAHFTSPVRRGDVVVFDGTGVFDPPQPARSPLAALGQSLAAAVGVPVGRRDYVKRVVGLPGETLVCCDAEGRITVDGVALVEDYLPAGRPASRTPFAAEVPAGRLWVMGDNRDDSADSRAHTGSPGGGTVPLDHVVGTVWRIWWPLDHAGTVQR